jgi:hypothetical protein
MVRRELRSRWYHIARHPLFPAIGGGLALFVYLVIAWFILPPQSLWSPDEGAKLLQAYNIRRTFSADAYAIHYAGHELDPRLEFAQPATLPSLLRVVDHALYFERLPIFPILVLPLFRWFGYYGLYVIPAVAGAASVTLALYLLDRKERRLGMWVLIACASPITIYATIFWEHTLAVSLCLAGVWLGLRAVSAAPDSPRRAIARWLATGIILGLAFYIRQETIFFACALLAACWFMGGKQRQGTLWAVGTLGVLLIPYVPLHRAMFGQTLPDNAHYVFYPGSYIREAGWRVLPDFFVGPAEELAIDPGWRGWMWTLESVIALVLSGILPDTRLQRALWLGCVALTVVMATTFLLDPTPYRSAHGLLFTTPWALLGLCRTREVWRCGSQRARIVVLTTTLGLIGYGVGIVGLRAGSPQGGLEWGARFAMPFYPLLGLIAGWNLGPPRLRLKEIVVATMLVVLGCGFQARGIVTLGHDKRINATINETLMAWPASHIVTDLWWLPLNAAPLYSEKAVYVVDSADRLAEWVVLASSHSVSDASLVTLDPSLADRALRRLVTYRAHVVGVVRIEHILLIHIRIESE